MVRVTHNLHNARAVASSGLSLRVVLETVNDSALYWNRANTRTPLTALFRFCDHSILIFCIQRRSDWTTVHLWCFHKANTLTQPLDSSSKIGLTGARGVSVRRTLAADTLTSLEVLTRYKYPGFVGSLGSATTPSPDL